MSLYKKIGLAGLPIILFGFYLLSFSAKDKSVDIKDEIKFSLAAEARPKIVKPKIKVDKKKISSQIEKAEPAVENNSSVEEDPIPWEEIRQDWHVVLKNHLLLHHGLPEEKVEEIFNQYMEEKLEFERISKFLQTKKQSVHDMEEEVGELDENNHKLLEELNAKLNRNHDHYVTKVKAIFGQYYASLCELVLVYSRELPYPNIIADVPFVNF